jgi:hypothetical protein
MQFGQAILNFVVNEYRSIVAVHYTRAHHLTNNEALWIHSLHYILYYIILYCKLYWTVKQEIPNGTSANGTRSPMRGTLPFYKLIKLQKLLSRLLYYN